MRVSSLPWSLPRTSGGLPKRDKLQSMRQLFAPHKRGSTSAIRSFRAAVSVCPAQAGVYLFVSYAFPTHLRLPRTSGGLPALYECAMTHYRFAPHKRGSTLRFDIRSRNRSVCPAQAGVYRGLLAVVSDTAGLPRTSGGLPIILRYKGTTAQFAPHKRGSTPGLHGRRMAGLVCPAQAGVYRRGPSNRPDPNGLPRTSGGLPPWIHRAVELKSFAPHKRGSTAITGSGVVYVPVCPAQAGVYPISLLPVSESYSLPRTSGGLPFIRWNLEWFRSFAPHKRGSTVQIILVMPVRVVCPAQAGVYPRLLHTQPDNTGLPRTSGGLPYSSRGVSDFKPFAPHRRGSTSWKMVTWGYGPVCPAQAGVYLTSWLLRNGPKRLPRTGGGLPHLSNP